MKNLVKRLMIHAAIIGGAYATAQMDMTDFVDLHAPAVPMQTVFQEEKAISGYTHEEIAHYAKLADYSYTKSDKTPVAKAYIKSMKDDGWKKYEFSSDNERSGLIFCRKDEVVVSYHGTESFRNVLTDVYTTQSELDWAPGRAHTGFLKGFNVTWDKVYGTIYRHATSQGLPVSALNITTTGHSLGGALATLAAYRLQQVGQIENVNMITYASPRVFDSSAAGNFAPKKALRISRNDDGVTSVPPRFLGFCHVGDHINFLKYKTLIPHAINGYHNAIELLNFDAADSVPTAEIDADSAKKLVRLAKVQPEKWAETTLIENVEEKKAFIQYQKAKYKYEKALYSFKAPEFVESLKQDMDLAQTNYSDVKDVHLEKGAVAKRRALLIEAQKDKDAAVIKLKKNHEVIDKFIAEKEQATSEKEKRLLTVKIEKARKELGRHLETVGKQTKRVEDKQQKLSVARAASVL